MSKSQKCLTRYTDRPPVFYPGVVPLVTAASWAPPCGTWKPILTLRLVVARGQVTAYAGPSTPRTAHSAHQMRATTFYSFVLCSGGSMRSLLFSAVCCVCLARLGGGQQLEAEDQSPDYSTIFQQFLLQKIREGEAWSSFDYEEAELPDRARNDVEEDVAASTQISGDEEVTTEPAAEEETVVVNTAPYQLTSAGGGEQLSGSVRLLQVAGSPSLVMAASLAAATTTDLFRDQSCVPGLYLVRDQRDCAQLPQVPGLIVHSAAASHLLTRRSSRPSSWPPSTARARPRCGWTRPGPSCRAGVSPC